MAGFPGRVVHHPLGHEHGFDQAPDARDILKTEAESPDVAVQVYGNSAWVEFDRDFVAKFRKDRSPITTHGRETHVKMPDGWRLVRVHYSGMPVTQERLGF